MGTITGFLVCGLLLVKEMFSSPTCSVSVYHNKSVAYIISEPAGPGCLIQWASSTIILVDDKGDTDDQVVLHVEPGMILTRQCQHNVTYAVDCQADGTPDSSVSQMVKCDFTCPTAPASMVLTNTTRSSDTGRSHVLAFGIAGIAALLVFVLIICPHRAPGRGRQ